ncbi:MAG: hypothetical protein KKA19_03010, partial [Candidatus Margulisbacteria bacterium]|nr:hypothetical protein [Candidatus Margulisiibacteriota bacterium]
MLFVLMSIYYTLKKRYAWSGLFSAISMLTKYTGLFVILIVIPLIFIQEKKYLKCSLKYLYVAIPLGSIWFIRNWIVLGNPVWHFLNELFGGYESFVTNAYQSSLSHLISIKSLSILYAGMLGVPASTWSNLFFFNFPFIKILLIIWLVGTGLFFLPILFGLKKIKKQIKIVIYWLMPFVLMSFIYIYNIGGLFFRFLFPIIPILGTCWALGFIKIKRTNPKLVMAVFILLVLGITTVEFTKAHTSSINIETYQSDFDWVKQNTNNEDVFLIEGEQILSFHLNRYTYYFLEVKNLSKIDYVWINPTLVSSHNYDKQFIKKLENEHTLVYNNNLTQTKVYKVKNK